MILVTGGAGFIGSNFVLDWLARTDEALVNLDKLTYAGNMDNLEALQGDSRHLFVRGDTGDAALVSALLARHRPRAVVHLAAESHVERSIADPGAFVMANVVGSQSLLECVRRFWMGLDAQEASDFRFVHVSTDEVYGSLATSAPAFHEESRYAPNSPYSASKAASDHFARAYHRTYGLPVIITHCSNNYGRYQFPEKLIPVTILNALAKRPLPVYGDGKHVRDWLYVSDHCSALRHVLASGRPGEVYNVGAGNEQQNLDTVRIICSVLDELRPRPSGSYADQISLVQDRPGHDRRYAVDSRKIERELGWKPVESFASGIRKTVEWYLAHPEWVRRVQSGAYLHSSGGRS
jgi:dTDP-glucose 4,6-dehydratase